ncbi:hypothetical protein ACJZ2D_003469 [Fusarium nematophilum]
MKSAIASIGMFAAMANAYSYPRHMHFRRDNGTDSGLTTLTVLTTQVQTVTSCAPTITDCPARDQTAIDELPETDKTTYVVTNTVVLTETVCPVTEAGSISKSVIQEAETGGITGKTLTAPLTADVPLSTGAYPPITDDGSSPETDGSSLTTIVSDYVTDKTVTLTLGTGTDASVTTTTVRSTIQTTVTVPCSEVDGKVTDNASPDEPTTTTTKTSTGTITKTVEQADTTKTQTPGNGDDGYSTGNGSDEGDDGKSTGKDTGSNGGSGSDECPEAVTVTVTAPTSTVYVTLGSDGSKTSGPDASEYCDETTTLEATVTVVPYPVNNTIPTSGYAAPTGFARRLR